MYHNEKVSNTSDQRDIVWFVSSACYVRTHWPECFRRVKRTFCFTGAIDVRQGAVVQRVTDQRLSCISFSSVEKHFFG